MIKEFRILDEANKLINSIASDSSAAVERKAMGGKPATRRKLHLNVWLTQTHSLLLLSNDNVR
ncbi:MAG TPA: hypothetical protein PLP33_12905 [Leptospiraceae bacterium]|nr:hypothetical protein [Leptospiraceae bacterium]HMX31150.1 hypothetical protein [Leptospiraceae bacterium]HMY30678.1 hypothetical protein [Leptospiraceae bacterium]HMZ63253.1 hypothetical protein [Leptospiraceae bacterium]HNC56341.1 hypothetical protein [Leptospiraceae bacterium]